MKKYFVAAALLMTGTGAYATVPGVSEAFATCCSAIAACCHAALGCCG